MKLDGVAAFVAVAETGSITGAARRLRLSKSVVSERLAELERALGASLIQRNARNIALTQDGIAFRARADRITAEAAQAIDELAERRGEMVGPLSIAAPKAFGDLHLAPALYDFLDLHPNISLTVDFDDRLVDAASGHDAVVRIAPWEAKKFKTHQLTVSRRIFVGAPSYLARYGRPRTPAELERHMAVHFLERSPDDWTMHVAGRKISSRITPRLRLNSCASMLTAAINGIGLTLLPTFLVHEALRDGRLERVDVGSDPDLNIVMLGHDSAAKPSAKLRALIEHLRAAFGDPPYWDSGI